MKSYISRTLIVCLVFVLCAAGCVKNVAGPKGEPGTPAKQGNLKIVSAKTFSLPASAWTLEGARFKASVSLNELSSYALAVGEIEIYMMVDNQWWGLPYGFGNLFMQAGFETEMLHLDYAKIHDGPPEKPGIFNFRIVVLEPAK